MKKNIFFLAVLLSFSIFPQRNALCKPKWVPIGSFTEDTKRKEHLYKLYMDNDQERYYGVHSMFLPEQRGANPAGVSFAFDGPLDLEFIKELKAKKNDSLNVLIPAMGSGRSVMDVLATHKKAHVYANDIRKSAFEHLDSLMKRFNSKGFGERITKHVGDIEDQIDGLEKSSIDLVYIANLFHFLTPEKVERILVKLRDVLKPEAKVFLAWRGVPIAGYKPAPSYSKSDCKGQIVDVIKQEKLKVKNPRYITKSLGPVSGDCIYPYYNANLSDMEKHAKLSGYKVIAEGESKMISAGNLGEYRFEDNTGHPADPVYPNVNHMILMLSDAKNEL